jgi:hypothetical protein
MNMYRLYLNIYLVLEFPSFSCNFTDIYDRHNKLSYGLTDLRKCYFIYYIILFHRVQSVGTIHTLLDLRPPRSLLFRDSRERKWKRFNRNRAASSRQAATGGGGNANSNAGAAAAAAPAAAGAPGVAEEEEPDGFRGFLKQTNEFIVRQQGHVADMLTVVNGAQTMLRVSIVKPAR